MRRRRQRQKDKRRQFALSSQERLLSLLYNVDKHPVNHRRRYATHLHKISRRHRLRLSGDAKRVVCRSCSSLLIGGENSRVRLRKGMMVIHCFQCETIRRIPYKFPQKVSQ